MRRLSVPVPEDAEALVKVLRWALARRSIGASDLVQIKAETLSASEKACGLAAWILKYGALGGSKPLERLSGGYQKLAQLALAVQVAEWRRVVRGLDAQSVRTATLKGILSTSLLGPEDLRWIINDIDILIEPGSRVKAKSVLADLGYTQNAVSHDGDMILVSDNQIEHFESNHYELFPFTKLVAIDIPQEEISIISTLALRHPFVESDGKFFVAVEVDVHHALSHGIDQDDVWGGVFSGSLHGSEARQISWETMVWFLCARLYHEVMVLGDSKLRPLIELNELIHHHTLDWDAILFVSKKYRLSPSLFYVLSLLSDYSSVVVPMRVLRELDADRVSRGRLHDFGDFTLKALNSAVLFRPDV